MDKFWQVFKHEYTRHVLRKRFLMALLSIPFFGAVILGISVLGVFLTINNEPIGYVDQAGILNQASYLPEKQGLFQNQKILPFDTETAASAALRGGEIQAFFILGPDYLQTQEARLVSIEEPDSDLAITFTAFVRAQYATRLPETIRQRVKIGPIMSVRSLTSARETGEQAGQIVGLILPFVSGLMFMIAVTTSGNYLLQALVEEKQNRTMEIVVTSVSPAQLMTGKILANMCVGLTQLIFWFGMGIVLLTAALLLLPGMAGLTIDRGQILLSILIWLPAFAMISALMAIAGLSATEEKEAQQYSSIFSLLFVSPLWFISLLIANPNSGFAVFMSLFPLTAPLSLPMRAALTDIPAWQMALSLALILGFTVFSFWLAARAFRMGMLRYGKRLTLREIFTGRTKKAAA